MTGAHGPDVESRTAQWFDREAPSPLLQDMGHLAQVLRDVSDLLHGSEPAAGDIADLRQLAEALRSRAQQLPQNTAAFSTLVEPDPDVPMFFDHSPLTGETSPISPPLRLERSGDHVVGRVNFSRSFEGPPGHVHGGWVASGFDEVMGMAQAMSTAPGMTGRLEVAYRRPTPLGVDLVFDGWVAEVRGRKIRTKATLTAGDQLLAEATGLFVSVDFDAMSEAMQAGG
ncbi:MAG: PaaI family thioesterase [Actinomycetota bacterium]|nr:PaaI family thioesterase [Actinomycetota bacterium]